MVHSTTLSWLQKGHLKTLSRVVFFLMTIFFVLFFRRPMVERGFYMLLDSFLCLVPRFSAGCGWFGCVRLVENGPSTGDDDMGQEGVIVECGIRLLGGGWNVSIEVKQPLSYRTNQFVTRNGGTYKGPAIAGQSKREANAVQGESGGASQP